MIYVHAYIGTMIIKNIITCAAEYSPPPKPSDPLRPPGLQSAWQVGDTGETCGSCRCSQPS